MAVDCGRHPQGEIAWLYIVDTRIGEFDDTQRLIEAVYTVSGQEWQSHRAWLSRGKAVMNHRTPNRA